MSRPLEDGEQRRLIGIVAGKHRESRRCRAQAALRITRWSRQENLLDGQSEDLGLLLEQLTPHPVHADPVELGGESCQETDNLDPLE